MWLRNALWVDIGFRQIFLRRNWFQIDIHQTCSDSDSDSDRSSSDVFRFCDFDLNLCWVRCGVKSENWKQKLGKYDFECSKQQFKVTKCLGNFVGKYWKRRSFVMIVNSAMLTMKTDEIGAAIWSQKAQQQNSCSEFVICICY